MKMEWTIIQDTREKKPLKFPANLKVLNDNFPPPKQRMVTVRLHTLQEKLEAGDYLLQGYEGNTIIERKGSLREIAKNCLNEKDRTRFVKALKKLSEACEHPILMLEGTPLQMERPSKHVPNPGVAIDALMRLIREYNVELMLLPGTTYSHRRACAIWVARLLIAGAVTNGKI
jgi:ERCC4-type nuclease